MKRLLGALAALFVLCALLFGAYRLGARHPAGGLAVVTPATPPRTVLYWYDPMKPDQHFDKPGKSPFMDMDLVPRLADETVAAGAVRVDPTVVQNLGVRTQVVRLGRLEATRRVTGTVSWDLRDSHAVNARVDAVVDRLYARTPFTTVRKGDPLLTLLAPQWSAAAAEYFALADAQSADGRALRDAARSRLRALGMTTADIASLRPGDARVIVRAPADGVVAELNVREGERVLAGAPMLRVNGLDHVWLEAAVPQAEVAGIAAGTPVTASIDALAGETFAGRVEVLLPDVDVATRTQRARIVLDNPRHQLAPGMFAQVNIVAGTGGKHPLVPDDALIATGDDSRVALAEGEGRFRVVRVRTGRSAGGMTEIVQGLSGGEQIVVSGQFLIDSEASLSGALERLQTGAAQTPAAHAAHAEPIVPAAPPGHGTHDAHGGRTEHRQ